MANGSFYFLKNQFKSKFISVNTKLSIYKILIRPFVLHGNKCWTLDKAEEEKLVIPERKILKKIFRPIQENNVWRILYNYKIYRKFEKYGETEIVRTTNASRIRWLGHLYAETFPTKKGTFSEVMHIFSTSLFHFNRKIFPTELYQIFNKHDKM